MSTDPRLLVQLDKLPGFNPVDLRVVLAEEGVTDGELVAVLRRIPSTPTEAP